MENVISVALEGKRTKTVPSTWRYDYGRKLKFTDIELPESTEVHMGNKGDASLKRALVVDGEVELYDEYFQTGKDIEVYVFTHPVTGSGITEYKISIPASKRSPVTDADPTPVQQDIIEQTIEQLGRDADRAENAADEAEGFAGDAESAARRAAASENNAAESARQAGVSASAAGDARTAAETAQRKAEEAQGKAEDAEESAEVSARHAYEDAERAEQAAAEAGYLDVIINEAGHLIYTRTDAVDVDFELVNGHLIMEAI